MHQKYNNDLRGLSSFQPLNTVLHSSYEVWPSNCTNPTQRLDSELSSQNQSYMYQLPFPVTLFIDSFYWTFSPSNSQILVRDNVGCNIGLEEIFIKTTDPLFIFLFIFSLVLRSDLNLLLLIRFSNLPQGIPSLVHQIRNY